MLKFYEKVKRPWIPNESSGSSSLNDPHVELGSEAIGDDLNHKKARIAIEINDKDITVDPALRKPIEEYDPRIRDEVRRRYILKGPCQPLEHDFPKTSFGNKDRCFQKSWFKDHSWLEYSMSKDTAFCFSCFLFRGNKEHTVFGNEVFTKKGFCNWRKAKERFRDHKGGLRSAHNECQTRYFVYKDQRQSIVHNISSGPGRLDMSYRTHLTASVDVVRLLLRNGLAFRGNDESEKSHYKGNFLEILQWYSERSPEIEKVCLKKAPKNNQLTSPDIQKDIVSACTEQTIKVIINDIGDRIFSILVDGARDNSVKEQMSFVLRYVDKFGEVVERFIGITHVRDTSAHSLKLAVENILSKHGLSISKVRGQGYDGASNMRGELNGLKVIDRIIGELNHRFTESNSELLLCIDCLDPKNSFDKFSHARLLQLTDQMHLKEQLKVYITEMRRNENFANLDGIGALAKKMVELDFDRAFHWVYKLIELALILPVATASVERTFSAMKIIKTDLRNKIEDDFLNDCMVCSIEKEIFLQIENDAILDHFQKMKTRRKLLPPKK